MGFLSSKLFTWLQGAGFYSQLHQQAADLLPDGAGKTWIDVGCGPGVLTRIAANNGYTAIGVDGDASMIKAAKKQDLDANSKVAYRVGDVYKLDLQPADVVSASSLLAVLGDRPKAVRSLMSLVKPGGVLMIIEPTDKMNANNAEKYINSHRDQYRTGALRLWSRARQSNITDMNFVNDLQTKVQYHELLDGMVGVWILRVAK